MDLMKHSPVMIYKINMEKLGIRLDTVYLYAKKSRFPLQLYPY